MAIPINAATAAYSNAARLLGDAAKSPLPGAAGGTQTPDFASVLSQALQGVVDQGKASDQKALDLVSGKGNLVDVATSVSQTQVAVEGLVAVRDRVISAYEDIMKMPI